MAKITPKIQLWVVLWLISLFIESCGGGGNGGGSGSSIPGNNGGSGVPGIDPNVINLYEPDDTGTGALGNTNNLSNIQLSEGGRINGFRVNVNAGTNIVHVLNNEIDSPVWSQRFKLTENHYIGEPKPDQRDFNTRKRALVRNGNIVLAENIGQITELIEGDITLHEYVDNDSNVYYLAFARKTGEAFNINLEVGGVELSNIPTGTFQYFGEIFISQRKRSEFNVHGIYFTMEANFDNFTGNIRDNDNLLTGNFEINSSNGTYFGNELRMTYEDSEYGINIQDELATIYGSFHNSGATGVSGIFFDNAMQRFGGAIIGASTTIR